MTTPTTQIAWLGSAGKEDVDVDVSVFLKRTWRRLKTERIGWRTTNKADVCLHFIERPKRSFFSLPPTCEVVWLWSSPWDSPQYSNTNKQPWCANHTHADISEPLFSFSLLCVLVVNKKVASCFFCFDVVFVVLARGIVFSSVSNGAWKNKGRSDRCKQDSQQRLGVNGWFGVFVVCCCWWVRDPRDGRDEKKHEEKDKRVVQPP